MGDLGDKLFKNNSEEDEIALHSAGATVRHHNPFESLTAHSNEHPLTDDLITKWVIPFYMCDLTDNVTQESFLEVLNEADKVTVLLLLGDFNWRSKTVGAYFAAMKGYSELEDIIGTHLLKSEVCYAGRAFSLALASFNTPTSKAFLKKYLDYYLTRKDLWFDQEEVLCALYHIDEEAGDQYRGLWTEFITARPYADIARSRQTFSRNIDAFRIIKNLE